MRSLTLDDLHEETQDRLERADRVLATTRENEAWKEAIRAVQYYENILALIDEAALAAIPAIPRAPTR